MTAYLWPALFCILIWWFSTGLIIYLDGLSRRTFKWSLAAATALLVGAFAGLVATSNDMSLAGVYCAFTCGMLAWAWQELAFYTGTITGPRKSECPQGCSGLVHFWHGVQTVLWHQLAAIAGGIAILWLTWDGANQIGLWTYVVLWWMQQSAKLNVFFGVRNLNEHFLPNHLAYLRSYLRKAPINLFFPISVTVSTVILTWIIDAALAPGNTDAEAAGLTFLATMLALAILEHWFLVLPIPAERLWEWSLASHQPETDRPTIPTPRNAEQVWRTEISGACDRARLSSVLTRVADGVFGDVAGLEGIARADRGWVRFAVANGATSIAACDPSPGERSEAAAWGPTLDEARLQAAFTGCLSRHSAT